MSEINKYEVTYQCTRTIGYNPKGLPADIKILSINEQDVAGRCESCHAPIMINDDLSIDGNVYQDDVYTCYECEKK